MQNDCREGNTSVDSSAGIRRPISLVPDLYRACSVAQKLRSAELDARSAVQRINDWPRSVHLAQLALSVERLRRDHVERCPICGRTAA
jgi:hypothetical protein